MSKKLKSFKEISKELSPLEAFKFFCINLDIENTKFANAIEAVLKEHEEYVKVDTKICAGSLLTCQDDFETIWKEREYIKKEFGIDFITLSEALICFYAKDLDCYCPHPISLYKTCGENGEWMISWLGHDYRLKDFRITWALSKKDLEVKSNEQRIKSIR